MVGDPDRARTYNLSLRRAALYPIELRDQHRVLCHASIESATAGPVFALSASLRSFCHEA